MVLKNRSVMMRIMRGFFSVERGVGPVYSSKQYSSVICLRFIVCSINSLFTKVLWVFSFVFSVAFL